MIQLFQNLLITTRQSDIFINDKKCRSNLSFGQAKTDTFEKSNIYNLTVNGGYISYDDVIKKRNEISSTKIIS